MKMYVIEYEDCFYDFEKLELGSSLTPSCLLPTRAIAELVLEELLSCCWSIREIEIKAVIDGVLWHYTHDKWHKEYDAK